MCFVILSEANDFKTFNFLNINKCYNSQFVFKVFTKKYRKTT